MFKLIIRSKPMIAVGALIAIGATTAAYFILKGMTDKLIELHLAAVIAAIVILPILVTLVAYQMTSAAQKVKVCTLMIGFVLILSSIDNFIFPQMRMLADSVLLFNWIAFAINLVGGIVAVFCLVNAVPDSVYGDGSVGGEKEDPKERKRREQEEKEAEKAMAQSGSSAVRATIARMPAINAENMVLKAAEETGAAKAPEPQPTTSAREEERKAGSTSATNLKGLLDTLAPEDDDVASAKPSTAALDAIKPDAKAPVKSMLKIPPKPESPASQLTKPGVNANPASTTPPAPVIPPVPIPEPTPAPEATLKAEEKTPPPTPANDVTSTSATTRLQAQKRKGTSTFTKLQALSASGGAGSRTEKNPGAEGGEGLKSILDRLDSTADTTEEAPMDSLFGGGRLVNSRTDIPAITEESADTNLSTPAIPTSPASPPSQLKRPGLGVTLGATKLRPEPTPTTVTPSTSPEPALAATPSPAPAPTPAAATTAATESSTAGGESISDMLNSIQTPSTLNKESGLGSSKLGSSGLGSKLGKSTSTNKIGIGSLGSTSSTNLTPVPEPSEAAAPELQQLAAAPAVEEQIVEESAPEPAHYSDEVAATPAAVENVQAEDDDSQSIFAKGLDQEIDDIFSNLVPEEAQKEVKDLGVRASLNETVEPEAVVKEIEEISQPATTQPTAATVEAEEESQGGLFKGLDQELDDIFDNLVPAEAQREVDKSDIAQTPISSSEPSAAAAEDDDSEQSSLFGKSLDSELDDIFSNLAPDEAQKKVTSETLAQVRGAESATSEEELSFAPPASAEAATDETSKSGKFVDTLGNLPALDAAKVPVQLSAKDSSSSTKATETGEHPALEEPAAAPSASPVKEIKEFGRLSARVSATAKTNETPGTMKTIGKLLIDVQAVENVIRNGETGQIGKNLGSARVLSAQRGEGIQMILNKIDAYPGIAGSLIVGHDGLVIASTLKGDMDRDTLGVLSVACLSTSNLGTRKLEIGKLKQMVMITNSTVNVFTDVDVGILAVFMSAVEVDKIDGLLETIQTTIHG